MNEIVPAAQRRVAATGNSFLIPQTMAEAFSLANEMARARMLPAWFHNNPGDCLIVIEQACGWNMSPYAVAQCTSNIRGKLMFEGKIVASAIERSGAIDGRFEYNFTGTGDDLTITVTATRHGEKTPRTVTVRLGDVRTGNQWWVRQPEQMLVYHGARVWGRRWTPGVMLGVYSPEEFNKGKTYLGATIDVVPEPAGTREAIDLEVELKRKLGTLDALHKQITGCHDAAGVVTVSTKWRDSLAKAQAAGKPVPDGVISEATRILSQAIELSNKTAADADFSVHEETA